jgi:P27 family predicted phage terminase small subunit
MVGRKTKPTALKKLEGNPGKRPLNFQEITPEPIPPTCPGWLLPEAKREWRRLYPQLLELGLLSQIDRAALAGYCQAYARWRQAEESIRKKLTYGYTNKSGNRNKLAKPEVAIAQRYLELVRAFCSEFGLTPSSRGRMVIPGNGEEKDPLDKILRTRQQN